MVVVVSKSVVQEGRLQEYIKATERLIEETRKEQGCIAYDLCQDVNDPNILTFVERWESREALDAHMKTAHFTEIVPVLKELRKSSELNIYKLI